MQNKQDKKQKTKRREKQMRRNIPCSFISGVVTKVSALEIWSFSISFRLSKPVKKTNK
jgi:hypothetical protein